MKIFRMLAALSLVLVLPLAVAAAPVPVLHVSALANDSSLVITGYVERVEELGASVIRTANGDVAGINVIATLFVDQIIKGASEPRIQVRYVRPLSQIGYDSLRDVGEHRIFFLAACPLRTRSPVCITSPLPHSLGLHSPVRPGTIDWRRRWPLWRRIRKFRQARDKRLSTTCLT